MQIPLQITFEGGLAPSDALRARIEREAAKLERYHDRITSCRAAVIGRGGRSRHGGLYSVRLQLTGPGLDVVITRNPPADHSHEDAFVAVRDAFAAARRQLHDRHGRMTGKVKAHLSQPKGLVHDLLADAKAAAEDADFDFTHGGASAELEPAYAR